MPRVRAHIVGRARSLGLLLLLFCLAQLPAAFAASLGGQVIGVPDANRLTLLTPDGRRLPVALLGLTLPDPADPKWRGINRRQLQMLLAGRSVSVDYTARNPQGVILGVVRHGGADTGLRLLRSGLSVIDAQAALPSGLDALYRQTQQEARQRGMGYWQSHR